MDFALEETPLLRSIKTVHLGNTGGRGDLEHSLAENTQPLKIIQAVILQDTREGRGAMKQMHWLKKKQTMKILKSYQGLQTRSLG